MVCELLGLVRYANLFWQNTGPAYEPELLYVIGLAVQTLVCDFVDAVYIHRSGWRIFGNSMTMVSLTSLINNEHTNQVTLGYYTSVYKPLL